ncbi:MAG: radical SAM protein, partial [Deltaproteobacteria bacterium]
MSSERMDGAGGRDIRYYTRLLTGVLARGPDVPDRVDARVDAGLRLEIAHRNGRRLVARVVRYRTGLACWRHTGRLALVVENPSPLDDCLSGWCQSIWSAMRALEERKDANGLVEFVENAEATPSIDLIRSIRQQPVVRLTLRCNARCPFCNAASGASDRAESLPVVSTWLERLRLAGADSVAFSGGEPTLLENLPDHVEAAQKAGFREVTVQTNATTIDESLARRLRDSGLTGALVSFHSHVPAVQQRLMGVRGAYTKALAGIENLLGAGVHVAVSTVVTKLNAAHPEAVVRMLHRRFGNSVPMVFSYCAPEGRARKNLQLLPRLGEVASGLGRALDAAGELGMRASI